MVWEMAEEKEQDLKNSEKRYQSFLDKRDELNEESRALRDERDTINNQKNEHLEKMKNFKVQRDELVIEMRKHKEMRNRYHQRAKALIEAKRNKSGNVFKGLPNDYETLRVEIQMLEMRQETVPLSLDKEKDLLDTTREKRKRLKDLEKQLEGQEMVSSELSDLDSQIDEAFRFGDEEHAKVIECFDNSQDFHDKYIALVKEVSHIIGESNKKHEEFLKIRDKANYFHQRAMEMREKVLAIRKEKWQKREEARKKVEDQNVATKEALENQDLLEEEADKNIEELFKQKKISL